MADTLEADASTDAPGNAERGPRLLTIEGIETIPDSVLPEGTRPEPIEGLIYEKAGQNDLHITAVEAVVAALQGAFIVGFDPRVQGPLKLGNPSKPEPDLSVLRGTWRDGEGRRPDPRIDVPPVVEVSDATLRDNRSRKPRPYATYGIPERWTLNLCDRTPEVRRLPHAEDAETRVYREDETATANVHAVDVADLLPKAA